MPLRIPFRNYITVFLFFIALGCKTASSLGDYGIEQKDDYFSIAVLPDTQYYTAIRNGGTMNMFGNQINWILRNKKQEKIAYVIHLGDITDHNAPEEWVRAKDEIYRLDKNNVPYGLAVGNHDQTPNGKPAAGDPNTGYSKYFGKSHFKNKYWYGGGMGVSENNDNHFDVFTANGQKFLVLYLVFNQPGNKNYNKEYEVKTMFWADSVLSVYPDNKSIIVTHGMLGKPKNSNSNSKPGEGNNTVPGNFTAQGKIIYEMAKHHKNVFLLLGGHIAGESFRRDAYNGNVIKSYLQDYQFRENSPYGGKADRNGGNGLMRLMRINTTKQTLSVLTFAPQTNKSILKEEDADSRFTEPLYK